MISFPIVGKSPPMAWIETLTNRRFQLSDRLEAGNCLQPIFRDERDFDMKPQPPNTPLDLVIIRLFRELRLSANGVLEM